MADVTRGLPGLTFESALSPNTGEVSRLDALRSSGSPSFGNYADEPVLRFRQAMRDVDNEGRLLQYMANWRPSRNQRMQSQYENFLESNPSDDIGLAATELGYGESRFDKRFTNPSQLEDIEDSRARMQSTLGVLANSIAKMGVLAGTTAADSWVGLPAGLINLAIEGATGNLHSGRDVLNAIVSNPVSAHLQGINDKSEEIFANYQTDEERNRPWWENMFTANFIGDTLIKNAGFTIGAVIGGKAAVNVLGKATGMKEARDAFKGLAAELGLAGKSASEVVELLAKGTTSLEKQAAVKALAESAAKLKNAELGLRIAGGLLAGTGEARIEALNGVSELERSYEEMYGNLDIERGKALNQIREEMQAQGIDINTEEGLAYYNDKKASVDQKYIELQEQIAHDKAMAANTIFALNVPLLTAGDMIQWGKLMLGGYALDRNVANGIKKVADKSIVKNAAKLTPEELASSTRYAVKGNKFTNTLGKVGAGSRNVFVEMQEEMNQSLFSQTAKAKAMGNTTEFMERLYDPMAVHDTVSWLDAAKEGMRQSWLNKDDWVEGFAGGFMGFMGLPSISVKVNEQTGKRSPKFSMEGGIWSPIREYNEDYKRRNELVNTLNNRLASKDFINYYYGKIGNRHFDSIKEDAVKQGDKNLYKKADHAQLINDAMMFERAGRLQDFIDIVDSFENVSDEKIAEIKKLFPDSAQIQSFTTSGMRTLINDNVDKMKRQLDSYLKIADNIKTVYGNTIDDNTAAELTWQTAHLDEIEHDLKTILEHPETSMLLSQFRSENAEKTKDLTDYEAVSSGLYRTWLQNKYKDKKDTISKSDLEVAINDANDAAYDMSERSKYIDNISALSSDPELIQKRTARIQRQQEELRRLAKLVKAVNTLSTTNKLSDFISAMEEFGEEVPEETLADIKREADKGNAVAAEYLAAKDVDSDINDIIKKLGDTSGVSEETIEQAKEAWNYLKQNSDTLFDLLSKHSKKDIAPDVAGEDAINLLNNAINTIVKNRDLYKKIKKREIKKEKQGKTESSENSTQFETTGNKLTKKKYNEIAEDIQKSGRSVFGLIGAIPVINLEKANILYDGKPASGKIYLYYKGNRIYSGKELINPTEVYDSLGNQLSDEAIEKLTGPDGQSLTAWISDSNFPIKSLSSVSVINSVIAKKNEALMPIGSKKSETPKKDSKKAEGGNDPGSKTNPHKFIAPNMDMSLLGGDSHAIAEVLKSLPEDSEVRFGMEEEDGPIYILAGDSNIKIGTLPKEGDETDTYSGLSELDTLIREEYSESSDRKNADGMWISEKYVNHIREKRNSGFETIDKNIPIDEIPGFDGIKKPVIMFVYNEGGQQRQVFSEDGISLEDVQLRAARGAKELTSGFAYLLVPSGKKYIPVMLYTQNIGANEETGEVALDLRNPEVTAKGYGKRVSDAIDEIVKAITTEKESKRIEKFKMWALNTRTESSNNSLQRLLYFNSAGKVKVEFFIKDTAKGHQDWFMNDDVVMVINRKDEETGEDDPTPIVIGRKKSDGSDYSLRDQIIDAINDLTYETESGEVHHGPFAQIHKSHFNDKKDLAKRISELVESKMLLTDVKDFDMEMPSFIMDYWSVKQKKFIRPSHDVVKKASASTKIVTKKSKGKGTEKIADMNLGGESVQYNLSSNQVKIGEGKWFTPLSMTKAQEGQVKKLGFKDVQTFIRTARALAMIADKYGDSEVGVNRKGNKVLLKSFAGRKDEGFVVTADGGRFMTASELKKFKDELKGKKVEKKETAKREEARRVKEARKETVDSEEEAEEYDFEVKDDKVGPEDEISRMETIHNVRQAIEHLRKFAPQYAPFLDYISKIGYYDQVLVELSNIVDYRNKDVRGRNVMRFRGNEYTNKIVIGRNSFGYQTLMHELVHAFTSVALKYDSALREDIKSEMDYIRDVVGDRQLSKALGAAGMYAFENPYEFVAEFFSNPKLQEIIKGIKEPQQEQEKKKPNVFMRILNYISDALKRLFKKETGGTYKDFNDLLYSVVDRQVELQKAGDAVFKTKSEFDKAKRFASSSSVSGVALATRIPTTEENLDFRYSDEASNDRSEGVVELKKYTGDRTGQNVELHLMYQLLNGNDEYSSYHAFNRLLNSGNVYEYNCGTSSSLIGVKEGDVFMAVRSVPVHDKEGSYDTLINNVSSSKMPVILAVSPEDVQYYKKHGLKAVHESPINGKVFMSNKVFTESDLYNIGTTFRTFAEVLDNNKSFAELRRQVYSDSEWNKFSDIEKFHARKCIGI